MKQFTRQNTIKFYMSEAARLIALGVSIQNHNYSEAETYFAEARSAKFYADVFRRMSSGDFARARYYYVTQGIDLIVIH